MGCDRALRAGAVEFEGDVYMPVAVLELVQGWTRG